MTEIMRPDELNRITSDLETARMNEALKYKKLEEERQNELYQSFMTREIHEDAKARINTAVRRAAEQGARRVQVFVFPSSFCSDGGRRINNREADWPDSLEGFAKRAFEFYRVELAPQGYKLEAEILNFPNDVPGDVGVFLTW